MPSKARRFGSQGLFKNALYSRNTELHLRQEAQQRYGEYNADLGRESSLS